MLIIGVNISAVSSCSCRFPRRCCSTLAFDLVVASSPSTMNTWVPVPSSSESPTSSIGTNADVINTDTSVSKLGLNINPPALIGIAAGAGAVALLLVLIGIFFILRHRRRKKLYPLPRADEEKRRLDPGASMFGRTPSPSHKRSISFERRPHKIKRKRSGGGPTYHSVAQRHQLDHSIAKQDRDLGLGADDLSSNRCTVDQEQEMPIPEGKQTVSSAITTVEQHPLDPFNSGFLPPPSPTSSEYVMIDADHAPAEIENSSELDMDIPLKNIGLPGNASIQSLNVFIDSPGGKPSDEFGALPFPITTSPSRKNRRASRPSLESTFSSFHMPPRPSRSESQDHGSDNIPLNAFDVNFFSVPFEVTSEEESTPSIMPPMGANGALTAPRRKQPSVSSADIYKVSPTKQNVPLGSVVPSEAYQGKGQPSKSETAISIPDPELGRTSFEPLPMPALAASTISLPRSGSNTPVGSPKLKTAPRPWRQFSSSSNLNRGIIFGKHKHSASVTSFREYKELGSPTFPRARSPTMTDANQYDFDIYRHREDDGNKDATTSRTSPTGRRQRLSLITGIGTSGKNTEQNSPITISLSQTTGGSIGLTPGYKRFSASMGDLPFGGNPLYIGGSQPMRPSPLGKHSLGRGSQSKKTEVAVNEESAADAGSSGEPKVPKKVITPLNLYIPKERLDGAASPFS